MLNKLKFMLFIVGCCGITVPVQAEPTDCSFYPSPAKQELTNITNDIVTKIKDSEIATGGFRKQPFVCQMTIKPDGTIALLNVVQSTNSEAKDSDLLSIIRKASPFAKHSITLGDMFYRVEFLDRTSIDGMNFQSDFMVSKVASLNDHPINSLPVKVDRKPDPFNISK